MLPIFAPVVLAMQISGWFPPPSPLSFLILYFGFDYDHTLELNQEQLQQDALRMLLYTYIFASQN